jgi:2-polyprenyl-3-methyl-5-hydroxy-6-metoxy-1,4-benzoquinol methylase
MSDLLNRESELQEFVKDYFSKKSKANKLKILEAGCGADSPVKLEQAGNYVVGIDISKKQIERNKVVNEGIVGDIQSYPLQKSEFDMIICWNVLEHLEHPDRALENFKNAIKPGGLIVIGIPNVLSIKGLVTKYTPHAFHIFFYKYVYRNASLTGKDDTGPFKTFLKYSISLPAIKKFAAKNNLKLIYNDSSDGGIWIKNSSKLAYYAFKGAKDLLKVLSFGRFGESELTLVMAKSEN